MKLARGSLKIIVPNADAARSNQSRARAGSRRLKPVWRVYVQTDDEQTFNVFEAFNFRASSLNPRHVPLGLRHAYPLANAAMRRALEIGVWFETRSEITLVTEQEVPAETTEETPVNGE